MESGNLFDRQHTIWTLLPLHPQPQPLEALTSYITRLAEANGLKSMNELAALAGTPWSRLSTSPDYPCPPYEGLARIAGCTVKILEHMTFQMVALRFGCSTHPQPIRRFLHTSIAQHLRYCPRCLAEDSSPYYRLHWRFLAVEGCTHHNCVLLDQCGRCGASLPLVTRIARMARCPSCQGELRTGQAAPLTKAAAVSTHRQTEDLKNILTHRQAGADEKSMKEIGKRFADLRQQKHLTLPEVAHRTRSNELSILEIEYGNQNRTATFDDYVQYAAGLGHSLCEIIEASSGQEDLVPLTEEQLFKQVDEIARHLLVQGISATPGNIGKHMNLSVQRLREFPRVNALLLALHRQHRTTFGLNHQRENELVQQVEDAIRRLKFLGEPITQQRIVREVGISYQSLRSYPRVEALLMQAVTTAHPHVQSRTYLTRAVERRETLRNAFFCASAEN